MAQKFSFQYGGSDRFQQNSCFFSGEYSLRAEIGAERKVLPVKEREGVWPRKVSPPRERGDELTA